MKSLREKRGFQGCCHGPSGKFSERSANASTWFIWRLNEVLGSEGFAIGILGVRGQPGVKVSAEHVHNDLGKHKQIALSVLKETKCYDTSIPRLSFLYLRHLIVPGCNTDLTPLFRTI